jgi:hypothetical protein
MIEDFHQENFDKGPDQVMDEALEPTAKAYYDMLSLAQKTLHEHSLVKGSVTIFSPTTCLSIHKLKSKLIV